MARYSRRRYRVIKKNKWSIEQRPGFISGGGWATTQDAYLNRQALIPIVTATDQEGVRKAKNLSISIATPANTSLNNAAFYYALLYAPEGSTPNELRSTGQLYQPSQYVISSGIVSGNQGKLRISSRLAKNLNQGDSIYLLIGTNSNFISSSGTPESNYRFNYLVRYAICYN